MCCLYGETYKDWICTYHSLCKTCLFWGGEKSKLRLHMRYFHISLSHVVFCSVLYVYGSGWTQYVNTILMSMPSFYNPLPPVFLFDARTQIQQSHEWTVHNIHDQIFLTIIQQWKILFLILIPRAHSYCVGMGNNPSWTEAPKIKQASLSSVNVSCDGLLLRKDCADQIIVKHWASREPNDYEISDLSKTPIKKNI